MKRIQITLGLLLAITATMSLRAQISAFTYQGRLNLNGLPANGHYDFMFRLLNDPTNGVAAPVILIALAVPVSNGLFTTGMDFGAENFDGANRWLEINVRTNGGGPFTTLSPRQLLTPTPYAIAAQTASNLLGTLPAGQISGTILNASLPASPSFSGTVTANDFSGNGADLTNLNATTLGGLNSSNFWRTTGNAGTTAGTHFLGTTDNQPIEIRVNGLRALRLEPIADAFFRSNTVNVIAGSSVNSVGIGVYGATIAGGGAGIHFGIFSPNRVESHLGTVSGGAGNTIQADSLYATVGGGSFNKIQTTAVFATIGGGGDNTIESYGYGSTINGGYGNTIQSNAWFGAIPGGYSNRSTHHGFAAGTRAKADHAGAFVWGDSTAADIASTNANSVTMRASGGYRFFTDTNATAGAFLDAGSGSWTSMSDRNAKENFRAADTRAVLEKVVALPVQTWNYKSQDASIRHIGPMAQDFKAAFGVGESDTGISTVDADGVALVAIQGLNEKLEVRDQRSAARIQKLEAENAELKQRLAELELAIQKLSMLETQP